MKRNEDIERMMRLVPKVRLGEVIEQTDVRNTDGRYGVEDACGMTIKKEIIPTKANLQGTDLSKFLVVEPNEFVYNPRTHGKRIGLGYNSTAAPLIISWNNAAFKVKDTSIADPKYLYMYFSRMEWDREACFRSWGSSTEVSSWEEMCSMIIPLPSIEVQRELVAVYKGLRQTAEQNEALLAPLADACHAYIVDCKAKYPSVRLGEYIEIEEEVNRNNQDYPFIGININKEFMPTSATTDGLDKRKYKIMRKGRFVFSGMQTGRDIAIRLGLYNEDNPALISPAYTTFVIRNDVKDKLLPELVALNFSRKESDRLGWFYSDSSVRSNLDWERFCDMQIPLPPIEIQDAIVSLYRCAEEAKSIAKEARELKRSLCPALIQKAANSL